MAWRGRPSVILLAALLADPLVHALYLLHGWPE